MLHQWWELDPFRDGGERRNGRSARTRVLIADDHRLFAEALIVSLGTDERIEIVGHALDGWEAFELASELRPDVVLMDLSMPRLDGIEATHRLTSVLPEAKVVMLSASADAGDMLRATEAGAVLYLTKESSMTEVLSAVLEVAQRPAATGSPNGKRRRMRLRHGV